MQTNVKSPCQIQIDACSVCVNKFIFAFVVVSFFVVGWGWGEGSARWTKIGKNPREKYWEPLAYVTCLLLVYGTFKKNKVCKIRNQMGQI